MPNFSSSGFANASSYSKFVKLLQDISMTSQFHRKFFAFLVWQIIWSQSCDCLFWESFSPLCNWVFRPYHKIFLNSWTKIIYLKKFEVLYWENFSAMNIYQIFLLGSLKLFHCFLSGAHCSRSCVNVASYLVQRFPHYADFGTWKKSCYAKFA